MKTKRKNAKRGLHKGKKIEAKKPLFTAAQHGSLTGGKSTGAPTESLNLPYSTIKLTY
jgi:hypothetical protein